jgi:acylphosphatase
LSNSSTQAFELTVTGDVQGVGYRRTVVRAARKLHVLGYVKNQPDGTVKIFVEGQREGIEEFVREITISEPPIRVENIERKERKPTRRYSSFGIRAGSLVEELQEGLGAGEEQLSLFRKEFKDYRAEFKDYRAEFKDYRAEFKGFASRTDDNFSKLNENFNDYRQEFRSFASKTDESFRSMDSKYGEISAKLTQILEELRTESLESRKELKRSVDNLSRLIDRYIEGQERSSSDQDK